MCTRSDRKINTGLSHSIGIFQTQGLTAAERNFPSNGKAITSTRLNLSCATITFCIKKSP